ncbi:MAG: glycosyltransferase family 4 protein [Alphaproteobacteria bacterium]
MKICVFSRDFPPDHGGVQTWMERIARHGGENAVVLTRRCPGDAAMDNMQSYRIKRMPRFEWGHPNRLLNWLLHGLGLFFRFAWSGIVLTDIIRDQKTDVVHCAYAFANGLPMMIIRILTGCPYVVYCHGTEILREAEKGGFRRWLLRLVLRLAVRVVVNSRFMQAEVSALVDPRKVIIAPLGADSGALNPQAEPATEVAGVSMADRRIIVTVGRIEKRKGHDMVIRALPAIIDQVPDLLWVVVGDGPEKTRLEEQILAQKLADFVAFTGKIPHEKLSALLARADLFLLPSRRIGPDVEGFGIVFLEAALFGTPAVGGNSGGIPDAIVDGETGLLCDGEDPADIAEKVVKIMTSPDLARRLGEHAKARAAGRTWANCCRVVDQELAPLVE